MRRGAGFSHCWPGGMHTLIMLFPRIPSRWRYVRFAVFLCANISVWHSKIPAMTEALPAMQKSCPADNSCRYTQGAMNDPGDFLFTQTGEGRAACHGAAGALP